MTHTLFAGPAQSVPQQVAQQSEARVTVKNNKLARALMLILEHEGSSKGTAGGPRWSGTISIEHVLPRNLKNEKAGWLFQPPGWNSYSQAEWLHRLGNLAMLNDSDNSSLGNVSFSEKVVKMQAFGHAPSWTIKDLLEHHKDRVWDEAAIQSRHTRLLDMLRSRWKTEKIAVGLPNQGL